MYRASFRFFCALWKIEPSYGHCPHPVDSERLICAVSSLAFSLFRQTRKSQGPNEQGASTIAVMERDGESSFYVAVSRPLDSG